ncbi:putative beta-1,3-galactosyltransferase 2 [Carex littledalei]|uniref:Hexosyltransferase n=1 Tax=Carex littledalei TaxID=544730 RepID=A0A833RX39_9POAL|nr:putative beta-1,3-galactosyltransferase 2 [Carex littledalei]
MPEPDELIRRNETMIDEIKLLSGSCDSIKRREKQPRKEIIQLPGTQDVQDLDKTISHLEMELAAARAAQESLLNGTPLSEDLNFKVAESRGHSKYFMVIGINTAFSSRKRRDSIRNTWMPQGEKRKKLEEEKGIIVRFVIGHSAISGGIVDRAIEAEDKKHGDFMRLDHVEGYLELSGKTKTYFATALSQWDADFYIKVDDDVHVNIASLGHVLSKLIMKPRIYIGCMKSGPVLAGMYINEDVSLGSWLIGLDVEHIDDKRLCEGSYMCEMFVFLFCF